MNFFRETTSFFRKVRDPFAYRVAPLRRSSPGAIKVNIKWLHYADHHLAPLARSQGGSIRRSSNGSIVAVINT